jgi:hypothetical protein
MKLVPETISSKGWTYNLAQQYFIPVDLTLDQDHMISTFALLDCRCSEKFMQETFARDHGIPILPLPPPAMMIGFKGHEYSITHSTSTLRLQIGNH